MMKPSKCEAWSNAQQSLVAVIPEMKSWAMKCSNVVVCGGVCVWCVYNDEVGCMVVQVHYGISVR
jgi:hypothetical protein